MGKEKQVERALEFVASSKKDLIGLPVKIKAVFADGLEASILGGSHPCSKVFSGMGNSNLRELKDRDRSGTYRAVYTVEFEKAVYVLHAFQKKSKSGIKTPKQDLDLIKKRLATARRHYAEKYENK